MAVATGIPTSMTVSYRCANSVSGKTSEATPERTEPWTLVGLDSVMSASPWRTFRWHRGQRHYSGSFWSATERDLVIYESRLELARLLFADFDRSVQRILAQPFLLRAEVAGAPRKHVPDYLLLTSTGPVVVDVKPQSRATKPDNSAACQSLPNQPRAIVRSAVLHLLWQQHFTADLTHPLSGNHMLRKAA